MNRSSLKIAPGADLQALLQDLAKLGPTLILDLGPKLISISAKATRDFVEAAGELLITATLPKIEIPRPPKHCCEIPETECPPRCVCDIRWRACPGGTVQAQIKVINTGSMTRNFTFIATPFSGPGNPKTTIQVSPASASLAPNGTIDVAAVFTVTNEFQAGRQYTAELQIYGAYEQCVCITLDVEQPTSKDCAPEHCEVKAGDLPVRIRAHQWYDHFQCTEPCVELLRQPPGTVHGSGTVNDEGIQR
jgi:hypothetical protein